VTKVKCAGSVWQGRLGHMDCYNPGKFTEDGKAWCGLHLPSRVKARQDKNTDKMHYIIKGESLRNEVDYQGRNVTSVARDVVHGLLPIEKLEKAVAALDAAQKKLDLHKHSDSGKTK
jgi:hypothetical protein